jgi:FG-GAP-like repeat
MGTCYRLVTTAGVLVLLGASGCGTASDAPAGASEEGGSVATGPGASGTPSGATDGQSGGSSSCGATATCTPANVSLAPAVAYPQLVPAFALAAGDVTGDGKVDIVTTDTLLMNAGLYVVLNKGDGTFGSPLTVDEATSGNSVLSADFNGDCKADVLVPGFDSTNNVDTIDLLLSNGDGTFQKPISVDLPFNNTLALVSADFNDDGKLDFAVNGVEDPGVVIGLWSSGAWSTPTTYHASDNPGSSPEIGGLAAGDLGGSGTPDLMEATASAVCVLRNDGHGGFSAAPVCYAASQGFTGDTVAAGDVNGDGKVDVALGLGATATGNGMSAVNIFLGNGDHTLGSPATVMVPAPFYGPVALVDVNNDQHLDLVTYYGGGTGNPGFTVWLNDGTGSFPATPSATYPAGGGPQQPAYGDLLGNGLTGMIAVNQVGESNPNDAIDLIVATCK